MSVATDDRASRVDRAAHAPAGRETDLRIAREVLHWQKIPNPPMSEYPFKWVDTDNRVVGFVHHLDTNDWAVPNFSGVMAHAWGLAERFKIGVNPWHGEAVGWIAIVHLDRGHGLPSALADTPALAISRAVLLAHARGLLP